MSVATKSAADRQPVLTKFGLTEAVLLGAGNESNVYALDDHRALRIYDPGVDLGHVRRLAAFYRTLKDASFEVALPLFESVEQLGVTVYCTERRLLGKSLASTLDTLHDGVRARAMTGYARLAARIAALPVVLSEFGEIVRAHPLRRASWADFIIDRAAQTLVSSREALLDELPGIDGLVQRWRGDVRRFLGDIRTPCLVHNDYFPGNVLVSAEGEVTALIDFSPVIGDPRLDVAGALLFLELTPGCVSRDSELVAAQLGITGDKDLTKVVDLYGTYYALYYSDCTVDDPELYRWCVSWLAAHIR